MVIDNLNTFHAVLEQPPEGGAEFIRCDRLDDLDIYPGLLETVLLGKACQLFFHILKHQKVRWSENQQIGKVLEQLDAVDGKQLHDNGDDDEYESILPVEALLLLHS
jgi:hypothetical protein